jgi:hypothetical protein
LVNRHAIRDCPAQLPDRHGQHLPYLAGRRLCSDDANGRDGNLLLRRRRDTDSNAHSEPVSDCNTDRFTYSDAYGYGTANTYSDSYSYWDA